MSTINVNYYNLDNQIKKLSNKINEWKKLEEKNKIIEGGGLTVEKLREIKKEYNLMIKYMIYLGEYTIEFLNGIAEDYKEMDEKVSKEIQ